VCLSVCRRRRRHGGLLVFARIETDLRLFVLGGGVGGVLSFARIEAGS